MRGLIWLTWRQHRWPIVVSSAITALLVVFMLVTASELASQAHKCLPAQLGICQDKSESTPSHASYLMNTVVFLPVLVAVFWGVPLLAREFEQRTLPLAWSQDVSRMKWLAGKTTVMVVLIGAMGTALAGASIHLAHEYHAHVSDASLFDGTQFQAGGWLPLTLGLAWLAVGIAAGAATRRVLVGIAVTGGLWIVRMVGMAQLRPKFMTPVTTVKQLDLGRKGSASGTPNLNDMDLSSNLPFLDTHGGHHSAAEIMDGWCGKTDDMAACLHQHGIVGSMSQYQPASRMGTFHLIENGMNLGLFVIALVIAWWAVKKTRTTVG